MSMTALQLNYDLGVFNDQTFKYEDGYLRLFAEFFNVYESIIPKELVLEIGELSTYQVMQSTEQFYWKQFRLIDQMKFFNRCYDFIKKGEHLETENGILNRLPETIKNFHSTYMELKPVFDKHPINNEDDEDLINAMLESAFSKGVKDDSDQVKAENEALKAKVSILEDKIEKLEISTSPRSKAAGSSSMDVDPSTPA